MKREEERKSWKLYTYSIAIGNEWHDMTWQRNDNGNRHSSLPGCPTTWNIFSPNTKSLVQTRAVMGILSSPSHPCPFLLPSSPFILSSRVPLPIPLPSRFRTHTFCIFGKVVCCPHKHLRFLGNPLSVLTQYTVHYLICLVWVWVWERSRSCCCCSCSCM